MGTSPRRPACLNFILQEVEIHVVLWPVLCHQITPAGDSEGGSDKNTS